MKMHDPRIGNGAFIFTGAAFCLFMGVISCVMVGGASESSVRNAAGYLWFATWAFAVGGVLLFWGIIKLLFRKIELRLIDIERQIVAYADPASLKDEKK